MGKESKLRPKKEWEPKGTGRQFFDYDAAPEGCDHDIWHLSLYFEDCAESYGVVLQAGRPIIYENVKRVLTKLPPPDIRTRARTTGITLSWVSIVENMIDYYFTTTDIDSYCTTNFCNVIVFEQLLLLILDKLQIDKVITDGTRIPQEHREIKESKRTPEQRIAAQIMQKKRTEEEVLEKLKEYRSRSKD